MTCGHQIAPDRVRADSSVAASASGLRTAIGAGCPTNSNRHSRSASLRSVLTRSADARGVLPGARTCNSIRAATAAR